MNKATYAIACSQVLEMLRFLPEEEYKKIPKDKIEIYEKNKDINYIFKYNPDNEAEENNILKEANAIIIKLFLDYFATDNQKIKINEILKNNLEEQEEFKREKYNPDDLFKNTHKELTLEINEETPKENTDTALIEYKESFLIRLKNFILKIFHVNK